MNKGIY